MIRVMSSAHLGMAVSSGLESAQLRDVTLQLKSLARSEAVKRAVCQQVLYERLSILPLTFWPP